MKENNKVLQDLHLAIDRLGTRSVSVLAEFGMKGKSISSMLELFEKLVRPECAPYAFIKRQMLNSRVSSLFAVIAVVLAALMYFTDTKVITHIIVFAFLTVVMMYLESRLMESEMKKERVRTMLATQITEVSGALTKIHAYQITTDAGEPVGEFVQNNLRQYALDVLTLEGVMTYPSISIEMRSRAVQERAYYRERLGLFMEGCVTLNLADGDLGPCFKEAEKELKVRQQKLVKA